MGLDPVIQPNKYRLGLEISLHDAEAFLYLPPTLADVQDGCRVIAQVGGIFGGVGDDQPLVQLFGGIGTVFIEETVFLLPDFRQFYGLIIRQAFETAAVKDPIPVFCG